MSSTLTLKVAAMQSQITFAAGDAQVATVLTYFISDWAGPMPDGLTQAQQNQWKLDQAAARIGEMVQSTARRNRLRDLQAQGTLETQADGDTTL